MDSHARLASRPAGPPHRHAQGRGLPLRVGTRGSPLALWQTRHFLGVIGSFCPVLKQAGAFQEHEIATSGDQIQDKRLADIGGKGLFAKEIHEALLDGRVDFAVHSLKDLETELPPGIALACVLRREDARDALILPEGVAVGEPDDPYAALPRGAVVGSASLRRQAQLMHARPDLNVVMIRGNVQTRLRKLAAGDMAASLLALAGLKRLEMESRASVILSPEIMVPAAGQGIVGITVRSDDTELCELLGAIEDHNAAVVATAERTMLAALDGSCHTPIGAHAVLGADGMIRMTGLVARPDGSFLLRRSMSAPAAEAALLGQELGDSLRADSPADLFS